MHTQSNSLLGKSPKGLLQGLRIDYVLVSPDVLPDVGPIQILDLPHKWSDHAALFVSVSNLEPPPSHGPVPESSKKMKQFMRQKQRSIATMFASRSSPKAAKLAKAAASQPSVAQSVIISAALLPTSREVDNAQTSISSLAETQAGEAPPATKRQKSEAEMEEGSIEENEACLSEAKVADDTCRADSLTPSEAAPQQSSAQSLIMGRKASKALKNKSEQAKRETGQQGIKSFFTRTAQQRQDK